MIKNISVFLSAFLATLMDSGDIYIVALATPIIMTSTGASILSASWVATGYIVALTVFAPLSGWLSALLTRRIFFLLSILTFVLFSVGCSLSTSIGVLIFFRILQGVSGAGIHPISQSLVIDLFPAKKRALGSVLYGFSPLMAPVIGPIVAGYILSVSTWNSLFLINLPVGILILLLAFFSVDLNTVSNNKKTKKIDIPGLFFVISGLSSLLIGITNGRNWGWYSPQILLLILIGLLLVLFFVFWELKSDNPVIDFKKLKSKPILICSILMFNIGFLFISLAFILPIFLSVAVGLPSSSLSQVYFLSAAVLTVVLFFTGTILKNVDPRIFIMFGSIC
ncbi:MAG: MFS transporter, partial [Myxococcaceae bacterium]